MAIVLENVDQIKDSKGNVLDIAAGISGGGAEEFVATGNIADGQLVGLKADGTVEVIQEKVTTTPQTQNIGSPTLFHNGQKIYNISGAFDSNENKIVIAYKDNLNSNYGTAVVGEVSGNSISFGSPVVFSSSNIEYTSTVFDSFNNKIVIAYKDSNHYGTAIVGTISGSTISFGSPTIFNSDQSASISLAFNQNENTVVVSYKPNDGSGKVILGTVSGNHINFGSSFLYASSVYDPSLAFDSNANKVVIAYRDNNNSYYGTAVVGTVSGSSISFGSPVVFQTSDTGYMQGAFDPHIKKVIFIFLDMGNGEFGTFVSGEISGNNINFDSPTVYKAARMGYNNAIIFDNHANKIIISYSDHVSSYEGNAIVCDFAGTVTNKTYNASSWLGIADEAITSGDSGKISMVGSVVDGLTGLTPNAKYYVNYDGTLTDTENAGVENGTYGEIGTALSSTSLLITRTNGV